MNSYMKKALHEYNMSVEAWRPYYRPDQFNQLPASVQSRIECRAEQLEMADNSQLLTMPVWRNYRRPVDDRCRCRILESKKHCAVHGEWPHGGQLAKTKPQMEVTIQ